MPLTSTSTEPLLERGDLRAPLSIHYRHDALADIRGCPTRPHICQRVSAHRELRITRDRPEHIIADGARDSPCLERGDIEAHCPKFVMSAEHEMSRVDVPRAGPFEEIACVARLEKDDG